MLPVSNLQNVIGKNTPRFREESMRNALMHLQLSILKDETKNCYYGLPFRTNKKAKMIYKGLNLKHDATPFFIEENKKFY